MKRSSHHGGSATLAADVDIVRTTPLRPDDIILSGTDHRDRLIEILRQARSNIHYALDIPEGKCVRGVAR